MNEFALRLEDNITELFAELVSGQYVHGAYEEFVIGDPKKRIIHKASVRDRVVHRLLYNALYPYFDARFFHDSYSCRVGKGTHRARDRFRAFANEVSANGTKSCHVLTFDIKKCFESVNVDILKRILRAHIEDSRVYELSEKIIDGFDVGLPLGNLTSQLFINVYVHELDHYTKHTLGIRHYLRYADDTIIVHESPTFLENIYVTLEGFLKETLSLTTHKQHIRSLYGGVDVLGEVFFAQYKRLRRSTERRMKKRARRIS